MYQHVWICHNILAAAAAAAAKLLQSCPTLCDPIDGSPPGSPVLGILQARTLEWVAISFSTSYSWRGMLFIVVCYYKQLCCIPFCIFFMDQDLQHTSLLLIVLFRFEFYLLLSTKPCMPHFSHLGVLNLINCSVS